jgi:DNA-binding NarL/FixJ family response regulator
MSTPESRFPWEFLIVSNQASVLKALTTAIHAASGESHHTSDTTAAMAYIARRKLDGIFVDTKLEGALNLVGTIRRGNSNRFAAVFACAGEDLDVSRLLNGGVNFVVHKPLDPHELVSVLKSATPMMLLERQRYQRHQLAFPVIVKSQDREQRAITANISRGGMAIRGSESLAPGSAIQFVLELPRVEPVHGRGEVAWAKPEGLMGIRFYLMGQDVKKTLWHWIERPTHGTS